MHTFFASAGTGSELIYLAQNFPQWQFTVEPAAPMLDVCRQRTEECGIASRCTTKVISIHFPPRILSMRQRVFWFHFMMQPDEGAIFSANCCTASS